MFHYFKGTTQTGFNFVVIVDHSLAELFRRRASQSRKSFDIWNSKVPIASDYLVPSIDRPFRICVVLTASDLHDRTLEALLMSSRTTPDGQWWLPIPSGLKRFST